ncbi:MAG: hypothetical protein II766_03325 [Paludibacteraceae bacterium]|jgi:hypothetical protein|nr:hypothetical protein [Paludibacteraceae bacterium]
MRTWQYIAWTVALLVISPFVNAVDFPVSGLQFEDELELGWEMDYLTERSDADNDGLSEDDNTVVLLGQQVESPAITDPGSYDPDFVDLYPGYGYSLLWDDGRYYRADDTLYVEVDGVRTYAYLSTYGIDEEKGTIMAPPGYYLIVDKDRKIMGQPVVHYDGTSYNLGMARQYVRAPLDNGEPLLLLLLLFYLLWKRRERRLCEESDIDSVS